MHKHVSQAEHLSQKCSGIYCHSSGRIHLGAETCVILHFRVPGLKHGSRSSQKGLVFEPSQATLAVRFPVGTIKKCREQTPNPDQTEALKQASSKKQLASLDLAPTWISKY